MVAVAPTTPNDYIRFQQQQAERLRQQAAEFQQKQAEAIMRQLAFEETWRQSHQASQNNANMPSIHLVNRDSEGSPDMSEESSPVIPERSPSVEDVRILNSLPCILAHDFIVRALMTPCNNEVRRF